MISTILGFVTECDTGYEVYNYSQKKSYFLSREQFSKVNVGNFPYLQFACPRYSDRDVIGYNGHVCFVKNGKLFDIVSKERCHVKPVYSTSPMKPRPFTRYCSVIKHCYSYEDVVNHRIDQRTQNALEIASGYSEPTDVADALLEMFAFPGNPTFFNHDWYRGCNAVIDYWRTRGECPVLSLDILK